MCKRAGVEPSPGNQSLFLNLEEIGCDIRNIYCFEVEPEPISKANIERNFESGEEIINLDQTGFGAFDGDRIIGFATVSHRIFGAVARYVQLVCLQISEEYGRRGIGRKLFSMSCEEARRLGADKLYISGHSSKESQAAYRTLGCGFAEEINEELAAAEPFDVHMEYRL